LSDRYHLRRLRTPREARSALSYVLRNARKHLAERIARVPRAMRPDPASSGRWFDGWARAGWGRASDACASVAPPRPWLLRMGWLRHGRVDPDEVLGRQLAKTTFDASCRSLRGPPDPTRAGEAGPGWRPSARNQSALESGSGRGDRPVRGEGSVAQRDLRADRPGRCLTKLPSYGLLWS
jgi:hypothetical protein